MEDIFTPEEKDDVLKECKNTSTEYFIYPEVGYEEQYGKMKSILRILYLDRYMGVADTDTGGLVYRLTDDGLYFRNWGGYSRLDSLYKKQEEKRMDEQRNWELTLKKYEKSTQVKILIWSAIITMVNTFVSFLISYLSK